MISSPLYTKAEGHGVDPLFIKVEPETTADSGPVCKQEELWLPAHHIECTPDIKLDPSSPPVATDEWVKCRWCPHRAASRSEVDSHAACHDKKCDDCSYVTRRESALRQHRKRFHTFDEDGNQVPPEKRAYIKRIKCPQCPYITAHRHALKDHLCKHNTTKDFKCATCPYSTKYKSCLRRHTEMRHPTRLNCATCQYVAQDAATLRAHLKTHAKTYSCNLCAFTTQSVEAVFQHVHIGHGLVDWQEIFVAVTQVEVKREPPPDEAVIVNDGIQYQEIKCEPDTTDVSPPPTATTRRLAKRLTCDRCDYATSERRLLLRHADKHSDGGAYRCDSCQYAAVSAHRLRSHALAVHNQLLAVYKCQVCDYRSPYRANWKNHMQKHSSVKTYKCDQCSFASAYRHAYVRHTKKHCTGDRMFQCDKCTFFTKFEGKLSWHLLRIHKVNLNHPFKCEHCDFSCLTAHRLKTHLKKSSVDTRLLCTFCDYTSTYRCQLRCHKMKHTENCEVVTAEAKYDKYVTTRAPSVVQVEDKKSHDQNPPAGDRTPSHLDDGVLFRKSLLKSNVAVRKGGGKDRPFSCQRCDYASRFKGSVLRHYQRQHSDQAKPFRCPHCEFATSTSDSIALHKKRSRLDVEMYCECGYSSLHKCQLALHRKSHNPYRCSTCTYSCKSRFVLETHMMEHSGVGLKCPFCDFVTPKKPILVYHMASHTGDRRYKCQFCDYSAMRSFLLDNHVKRMHADASKAK